MVKLTVSEMIELRTLILIEIGICKEYDNAYWVRRKKELESIVGKLEGLTHFLTDIERGN